MTNAHSANEPLDRLLIEDIPDHTVRLALVETPLGPASDYSAGILASVLQERQTLADLRRSVQAGVV